MGKVTSAIFVLDAAKKHSVLYREEGQTGNWQSDPKPKLSSSIYVVNDALQHQGSKPPQKIKITVEEVE